MMNDVRTQWRLRPPRSLLAALALLVLPAFLPAQVAAQSTVTGTVTESGTQRPLVNAQVSAGLDPRNDAGDPHQHPR